jgi:hypothetical protein
MLLLMTTTTTTTTTMTMTTMTIDQLLFFVLGISLFLSLQDKISS